VVAFRHYFLQSAGPIRHHGSGGDAEALGIGMQRMPSFSSMGNVATQFLLLAALVKHFICYV
jgi:hypothetical protein